MSALNNNERARELLIDLARREPMICELLHTIDEHYAHVSTVIGLVSIGVSLAALHGLSLERMSEIMSADAGAEPDVMTALAKTRAAEKVATMAGRPLQEAFSGSIH